MRLGGIGAAEDEMERVIRMLSGSTAVRSPYGRLVARTAQSASRDISRRYL